MILRKSEQGVYRDLIAQAHNGSGKTTCFVLAMLSRCVWGGVRWRSEC
jgi:superfamily II DNA/RNA helicase